MEKRLVTAEMLRGSNRFRLWSPVLAAVAVAILIFQVQFGLSIISAANPFWTEPRGDMATMMGGHDALLNSPWRFPWAVTDALRRPDLVSTVYTDSIPWLSLALKATGLGRVFNLLGLFLLLAYVLQPIAMGVLLRASGVKGWTATFAGCVIAVLIPAWLARQFGHIALGGHWLLLFALALSVASARFGLTRGRITGFALLGALCMGIHTYHLPPVAACVGAALLSELLQRRPGAVVRAGFGALAFAGAVGLSAWVLGYGIGQGLSGGAGAIGFFSMNIAAPAWPQASALAGQTWNGAWFTGTLDANGAQTFEGFNYLGAGVLALLAAALVLTLARRRAASGPPAAILTARFGPLVAAMIVLTLWAIGPRAYFGTELVYDIGRPDGQVAHYLGLLRAHGRFFWIVGYALLAFAVVVIDRTASRRIAAALCLAALALQAFDVSQLMHGVRQIFRPTTPYYDLAFRTSPAFADRPWRFLPNIDCAAGMDALTIVQMSAMALRRGGSSDSSPTARAQKVECPVAAEAFATATPLDRTITVVAAQPGRPDNLLERFSMRTDCYKFVRGLVCGSGLAGAGLPPAVLGPQRGWVADQTVSFTDEVRPPMLGEGWSQMEPNGVWSDGRRAVLIIDPPAQAANAMLVEIDTFAFAPAPIRSQRVRVLVEGRLLATWEVSDGAYQVAVPLPPAPRGPVALTLELPDAKSPASISPGNPDTRVLGVGLRRVTVLR